MSGMSPEITEELTGLLLDGEAVLDVGCGDASLLTRLSGGARRLCGIDPAFSGGPLPPVPEDVRLLPGAAEAIPFPEGSFDRVVLQCVFSLCRPREAAAEVFRVLQPGGRLLLADLYAGGDELPAPESPLLGNLWRPERIEGFFSHFHRVSFTDLTPALTEMLVEAIWRGEEDCLAAGPDLARLRRAKARYGLWLWEKPRV